MPRTALHGIEAVNVMVSGHLVSPQANINGQMLLLYTPEGDEQ